jgi:hypothetical protein
MVGDAPTTGGFGYTQDNLGGGIAGAGRKEKKSISSCF